MGDTAEDGERKAQIGGGAQWSLQDRKWEILQPVPAIGTLSEGDWGSPPYEEPGLSARVRKPRVWGCCGGLCMKMRKLAPVSGGGK